MIFIFSLPRKLRHGSKIYFVWNFFFQNEIIQAVGQEAFELGLLMGTESDPLEEEQTQVYCFHHLLLLEYTAARFVSTLPKVYIKQVQF